MGVNTFRNTHRHVPNHPSIRPEAVIDTFGTWCRYVLKWSSIRSEEVIDRFGTYRWVFRNRVRIGSERITPPLRNVSLPRSERIDGYFGTYPNTSRTWCRYVPNLSQYVPKRSSIGSEPIPTTFRTYRHYVLNLSMIRPERIDTTSGTYRHYVLNVPSLRSEPITTTFRTYRHYVRNLSPLRSEPIDTTSWTYRHYVLNLSMGSTGMSARAFGARRGGKKHIRPRPPAAPSRPAENAILSVPHPLRT